MNRDIDPLIGRIAPTTDARAAELLSEETAADLADRITRTAPEPRPQRTRRPRKLLVGVPLAAAAVACAAVTVAVTAQDERAPRTPRAVATTSATPKYELASALTFTRKGEYINVRVRDPLADPERYKAEFAAHGLDVELSLVPASPSIVGTLVAMDTSEGTTPRDIKPITAEGECRTGGGGDHCPVGVRVSTDFEGTASLVFGRQARADEKYNSSAPVTAPGEAMHGMTFRNHRVGEVLAALRERNVTVPEYRVMDGNVSKDVPPDQVPPTWYVHDAVGWAKNEVMLFVGPERSKWGD